MKKKTKILISSVFLIVIVSIVSVVSVYLVNHKEVATETSNLSNEKNYVETYNQKNNVNIAKVDTINVKKSLVKAVKQQSGIEKSKAKEITIELVAVDEYVKKNNIKIDKAEYSTFYESNAYIADNISDEGLSKMNISRNEFLNELNYLTDIFVSKSVLNGYVFQRVIDGDWIIDDKKLNEQYINCVDDQKKFHNRQMSYGECYSNYQKFFYNYCEYIVAQSKVIYY